MERTVTPKDLAHQLVGGEMLMSAPENLSNDQLHSIGIVEGKKATIEFESWRNGVRSGRKNSPAGWQVTVDHVL